jgi:aminopeptidase N
VDDFNMGAMENKSLNIFNSRLVLASPQTATDDDYAAIEGVIGHGAASRVRAVPAVRCCDAPHFRLTRHACRMHARSFAEFFHNMTGNRITCSSWFQLSLKEGLTVYRDQEFSSDMNSRPVKRIEDVRLLRARQFAEDAGPMAHPVRPAAYAKIDNFYTLTVYEKGSVMFNMR